MTTEECDAILHDVRDAVEKIQEARGKCKASDIVWCRAVVAQRMTDAGRKLLEAERQMHSIRDAVEKLARGEELGPLDGIDLVTRGAP